MKRHALVLFIVCFRSHRQEICAVMFFRFHSFQLCGLKLTGCHSRFILPFVPFVYRFMQTESFFDRLNHQIPNLQMLVPLSYLIYGFLVQQRGDG